MSGQVARQVISHEKSTRYDAAHPKVVAALSLEHVANAAHATDPAGLHALEDVASFASGCT